jgi:hypothetical protein
METISSDVPLERDPRILVDDEDALEPPRLASRKT